MSARAGRPSLPKGTARTEKVSIKLSAEALEKIDALCNNMKGEKWGRSKWCGAAVLYVLGLSDAADDIKVGGTD